VHEAPAVHALHVPALQTWLVPHEVPLGRLPVELHTATPVEHDVVPFWQGLPVEQEAPAVQALHVPLSQTRLSPQPVPLATFIIASLHTGTPVEHAVVPV
jgi:hypothetical protein